VFRAFLLAVRFLLLAAAFAPAVSPAAGEPVPAYDVVITAPGELDDLLRETLDIVRWRSYEGATPELIDRLAAGVEQQAFEAVATRGYFAPAIAVRVDADAAGRRTVHVDVDPGAQTRVRAIRIAFRGAVVDEGNEARMTAVREAWPLDAGEVFRQADWNAAKRRAVDTLAASRYAGAAIASSRADVDPVAGTADLDIELDSGPPFYFGTVAVLGLSRHGESEVLNLAPFRPGDPYTREELEVFQRRLTATNYFASVQILLDDDRDNAGWAPVTVSVVEAPSRRLELGLGYTTDTLARATLVWRNVNVRDAAWRWRTEARIEQRQQLLATVLDLPARGNGWGDSYDLRLERTDIENLETVGFIGGYQYRRLEERNRLALGVQGHVEYSRPQGAESDTAHTVYPFFDQTWRTTDELLSPRRGLIFNFQLGAGVPGVSSRAFTRAIGRMQYFFPLGRDTDLTMRAEAGAVIAGSRDGIPQSLLFRTGGDTTVRGYAFQSIGVPDGDAIVGGRFYTLGSLEVTRWIGAGWGLAAFVDAGDAVDRPADTSLSVGYGAGVRVRSPIGPFRLDFAYGEKTEEFRIHFSVGVAF
jgi:translocation and assembly module TamA